LISCLIRHVLPVRSESDAVIAFKRYYTTFACLLSTPSCTEFHVPIDIPSLVGYTSRQKLCPKQEA